MPVKNRLHAEKLGSVLGDAMGNEAPCSLIVASIALSTRRRGYLGQQAKVIESLTDRQRLADRKDSHPRQIISSMRIGVCRHRTHIVGQDHTVCLHCPRQYHRVWLSRQAHILNAYPIQSWQTLAVRRAKSQSEVRAVGIGSSALFGAGMGRETHFTRGPTTLVPPRLLSAVCRWLRSRAVDTQLARSYDRW